MGEILSGSESMLAQLVPKGAGGEQSVPSPQAQQPNKEQISAMATSSSRPTTHMAPLKMDPGFGTPSAKTRAGIGALAMFMPFLAATVQGTVQQHKQHQINEVVNEATIVNAVLEAANQRAVIEAKGDPQKEQELTKKYASEDPRLRAMFDGPAGKKRMKNFAKAFSVDWMNPEKSENNAHYQGIQKFLNLKKAEGQVKEIGDRIQARRDQQGQGGGPQQPGQQSQGQPDQVSQFMEKLPTTQTPPDPKKFEDIVQSFKALVEAEAAESPKTEFQAYQKAWKQEHDGKPMTTAAIMAYHQERAMKPVDDLIADGLDMAQNGDMEGAKKAFDLAHMASMARKGSQERPPNKIELILRSNKGDKESKAALDRLIAIDDEHARNYGIGRAMYQLGVYVDKEGHQMTLSNYDAVNRIRNGEYLYQIGKPGADKIIGIQQLQKEAGPIGTKDYETGALKGVMDNIATFDNANDRAIYARVLSTAHDDGSDAPAFVGNVLNQALRANLSTEGRAYAISALRLAETMGRLRSTLTLPSTNQSMQLTYALMPGAQTPDSSYARQQLLQLDQTIANAIDVPILQTKRDKPSDKPAAKEPTTEEKIKKLKESLMNAPR